MTKKLLTFLTLLTLFFGVGWADDYVKVTSTADITSGTYLIVYEDGGVAFNGGLTKLDATSNTIGITISNNRIASNSTTDAASFSISVSNVNNDIVGTIRSTSGKYIGKANNTNGLDESTTEQYSNTFLISNGDAVIYGTGGAYLRFNATSNQNRFRYFSSSSYTNQKAIQLYKLTSGGTQPTTYKVNLIQSTGGTISANPTTAAAGATVNLTATPDAGYEFTSWEVLDGDANEVTVTNNQFTMPASDVEVEATFTEAATSATEWVLTSPSALTTGDVVLIVDKYSALAMSNDKGTGAAPSATSVTLNSDKSKVVANVTDALKWNVTNDNGTFQFTVPSSGNYLYATNANNGVRVGNQQSALTNNEFTINNNFLFNTATSRYLGVYNNQDWRCYTSSSTNISETEVAFYKKVETGSHSVTVGTITGEGNITPSSTSANTGDVITVTAEPASGYELTALAYNGTDIDITSTPYTFTMPNADVTLTATFSLKNYVVAYEVTPSTAAANSGNRVGLINGAPYDDQTHASHSQMGTSVTFKLYTGNGWQIDDANVSVAYTDANGNPATLTPTKGDTNNDDGGYGTYFTFTMPASDVMINAAYLPYQPDLYILGNVNDGTHWNDGGLKMTYDPSANTYSIRIYASEENGYFRFYANGGNNGNPSYGAGGVNLNPLEGTQPKDLWKDGDANFCVPAGIYDIVVGQIFDDPTTNNNPNWWGQTTVTVTKIEPTFTFTPAAGEVYQGTTVTASSNLYTLLHAINSSVTESSVTNEVSIDGTTFSSSVALDNTGSATVTGKATYGYIQPTATANYTVNEIDTSSQFELVTSTDDIGEDVEYVIMNKDSGSGYAMSTTQNNNNRGQTDLITIANSKIIPTNDTQIITLEAADDDGWYLKVASDPAKYLYTVSSSNHLKTGSTLNSTDQYYIAKISVNETSHVATIEYQTPTKKYLRRNSGSNIFSCYESGQQEVYLYKRGTVTPTVAIPTFSPEAGTYNEAQSVTISCATDGATILYSTDGTNYSNYTGAITVSETTTLYAKATKDGVTSQVATAEYTINIPVVGSGDFTLVENDNAIKAGREYIIISKNKDYAAGAYSSGRFAGSTSFTLTNDDKTASIQNDVKVFTLEDSETEGYYYLKDSEGNYYTPSQSSGDISQTKTNLSVTYGGGFVKITTSSDTRQIGFNDQNGQKKFGSFTNSSLNDSQGGLHHIYLYYRDGGLQKPEFTPAPGMYDVDVDVTITCATDGATIYYTTDDSEPSATNGTEYTGEIVVSQTTTFKAIAVKDGETSQIVSATYTITPHTAIETVTLTYSEPFTSGIGKFVVQNESGFSPVWTLDGNYGIKGTSFSGGVNYAATSRFLSPIIDMTDATQPELTFAHQINSFFTNASEQCTLWIRETTNGTDGTWIQLPLSFQTPAQNDWSNDYADIDLSAYAGKKVQISFLYSNPVAGTGAGTWEIQHFVVADNSEYRLVNNIAEFLALENGTKAKFKNPVTVLYDYSQYSLNTYQEYIWVKDESGFTQIFLQPSLDGKYGANEYQRAYYENGDVIPAGFIVTKQYYANGGYYQAFSNQATEEDKGGFQEATQKALADPEPFTVAELANLEMTDENIATYNNRYVSVKKLKITSKSGKNFNFTNDQGITTTTVGYNKYSDSGSVLKDGNTSAVVTVPAAGDTYYDVTAILQKWGSVWEIMPITFTPWEEQKVTLRDLCEKGTVNKTYTISNRLQCVYIREGNKLWVKDDNGQSILKKAPAEGDNNYEIGEEAGNKQLDQSLYDQSNWLEVHLADGSANAQAFYRHIIKGGAITGTFTNKTNPTMVNVELTSTALENSGTVEYAPNYYCAANFYNGIEGGNQACMGSENHGNFFFMNPKPQEYAQIVWAQWDGTKMIIPTGEGANEHRFNGEFEVNMSMNSNPTFSPTTGKAYKFEAIVRRIESTGGNTLRANKSNDYIVYPLNLSDDVVTGINNVTGKAVAGVKYYNLAGMESDRPFEGVNIIVTTYTDGSRSSAKVLK